MTTGKRAKRIERDLRCPIGGSAIGQASRLIIFARAVVTAVALPLLNLPIAQRPNISFLDEKPEFKELFDAINATKEVGASPLCSILDIHSNLA